MWGWIVGIVGTFLAWLLTSSRGKEKLRQYKEKCQLAIRKLKERQDALKDDIRAAKQEAAEANRRAVAAEEKAAAAAADSRTYRDEVETQRLRAEAAEARVLELESECALNAEELSELEIESDLAARLVDGSTLGGVKRTASEMRLARESDLDNKIAHVDRILQRLAATSQTSV